VLIDHFGLFGAAVRPVNGLRLLGIVILVSGLVVTQIANAKSH
jgi:transporter family-2 protein